MHVNCLETFWRCMVLWAGLLKHLYRSVSAWFEEQLAKSTFDGQTIRPTSWDVARNAPLMMYKPPYEMSINRLHRITQVAVNDSIRIYMFKKIPPLLNPLSCTLPEIDIAPWKFMVWEDEFPFGIRPMFRCENLSLREGGNPSWITYSRATHLPSLHLPRTSDGSSVGKISSLTWRSRVGPEIKTKQVSTTRTLP